MADDRVVIGSAGSCPPWARCAAVTTFHAYAIGSNSGWSTLHDLDVVHLYGQSRNLPETAMRIEPETIPLPSLRKLAAPISPSPSGSVTWTVADLLNDQHVEREGGLVVEGWLVSTPELRCQARPVPSGQLDFGCDEQDWLTDTEFQPWTKASVTTPREGIQVQNGSYRTFAVDPAPAAGGGLVPRYGAYLMRPIAECANVVHRAPAPCSGPPGFIYEIVDRISP
jgi:hypothetical protein